LENSHFHFGDTVAVMDWDSHRYLECFFAVPMMGAILHTINIRLTSEQLIYTINHAEDDVILVNEDFVPLLESVKDKFETVKKVVLLADKPNPPESGLDFAGEYEALVSDSPDEYIFPNFDENTMAMVVLKDGFQDKVTDSDIRASKKDPLIFDMDQHFRTGFSTSIFYCITHESKQVKPQTQTG
jgi:fatty-acyl-CoA synthase